MRSTLSTIALRDGSKESAGKEKAQWHVNNKDQHLKYMKQQIAKAFKYQEFRQSSREGSNWSWKSEISRLETRRAERRSLPKRESAWPDR